MRRCPGSNISVAACASEAWRAYQSPGLLRAHPLPLPDERLEAAGVSGKARLLRLLPGEPLLNGMPASKFCSTAQEIQDALDEAEQVREEGIIVKVSPPSPKEIYGSWHTLFGFGCRRTPKP